MAAVYVNNLVINAGSNFSQTFTLESSDTNSTLNLTGYIVESQMRKYAGSSTSEESGLNRLYRTLKSADS